MKSLFRSKKNDNKLISKRLNSQRLELEAEEDDLILAPIVKKRKQFKGLNLDQLQTTNNKKVVIAQIKDQIGLICDGGGKYPSRDKQMEEYIQTRLIEQKQKISTKLDLEPGSLIDQKMADDDILNQLPDHLVKADPLAHDRDTTDKPIQWVAGMMEVQQDPLSRIQTMELMIEQIDAKNNSRKIISRGPRGNFQGPFNTRIAKGEYSQMMKALNYDHHQDKSISERTKNEREKQQQNQLQIDL